LDIFLDDEAVAVADAETLTVEQLAQEIRTRLSDHRRLLTSIRCDGQTVESGDLESALAHSAGRYGRIEFQSSDLGELVRGALTNAAELFDQSDDNRRSAADLLNEGQISKAMTVLGDCFKAWLQAHEAVVRSSRLLRLDIGGIPMGDVDVSGWLGLLRDKLQELKEALEVSDHVLVADILRYEFDDISEQWKRVVTHLTDQAATA
jgi:hypothetical protein